MFHCKDGLFFRNHLGIQVVIANAIPEPCVVDGEVKNRVNYKILKEVGLTEYEFASVVAAMSRRGETAETYKEALDFITKSAV